MQSILFFAPLVLLTDLPRLYPNSEVASDAQTILKAVFFGAAVLSLATLRFPKLRPSWARAAFFSYLFVCAVSVAWSVSVSATLVGLVTLFGTVAIALQAARLLTERDLMRPILHGSEAVLLLSFAVAFLEPSKAFVYLQGTNRLAGITFGPHGVARCAALVVLLRLYLFRAGSLRVLVVTSTTVVLSVLVIVLADSRQVALSLAVAVSVLALYYLVPYLRATALAAILAVAIAITMLTLAYGPLVRPEVIVREDVAELYTLTGRTAVWAHTVSLIERKPLTGYGFNAGQVVLEQTYTTSFGWTTRSAHNMALHAALDVGLVGAGLLAAWLLALLLRAFRRRSAKRLSFYLWVGTLCLVERVLAGPLGLVAFTTVCFAFFDWSRDYKRELVSARVSRAEEERRT